MILDLTPRSVYEAHAREMIRRRQRRINDSDLFKFVTQDDVDRGQLEIMTPVIVIRRVGEQAGAAKQFEWNTKLNSSNYYIINHSSLDDAQFIQLINNTSFAGVIKGETSNSLKKRVFIDTLTAEYYALKL
jgi:hypothetical protein